MSGAVQYQRQPEQGLKIPATLDVHRGHFVTFTTEELKALNGRTLEGGAPTIKHVTLAMTQAG